MLALAGGAAIVFAGPAHAQQLLAAGTVAGVQSAGDAIPLAHWSLGDRSPAAPDAAPDAMAVPAEPVTLAFAELPAAGGPVYGPQDPANGGATRPDRDYRSFGAQFGAVKWETAALFAYITVSQIIVTHETESFHFQNEGWFGKDTTNLGVDKLTHAFNSYLLTEFLGARIRHKSGGTVQGGLTAATIAVGLMAWSELFDAHKVSSGWSNQDVISNISGAAFSVLRQSVPGLKEKLDFRLLVMPNSDVYTFKGKRHYEQQRFFFALQLAGFDALRDTPLRFVELHAGYRASGFTNEDRARGEEPRQRPFVGIGLNLNELFFRNPRSRVARAASSVLDYIQVPYTAVHVD